MDTRHTILQYPGKNKSIDSHSHHENKELIEIRICLLQPISAHPDVKVFEAHLSILKACVHLLGWKIESKLKDNILMKHAQ